MVCAPVRSIIPELKLGIISPYRHTNHALSLTNTIRTYFLMTFPTSFLNAAIVNRGCHKLSGKSRKILKLNITLFIGIPIIAFSNRVYFFYPNTGIIFIML